MYGEGNCRLCGKSKKSSVGRNVWKKLQNTERKEKFAKFLKKKNQSKEESGVVVSTYSDFVVPALSTAKKPGQRSRIRATKTWEKTTRKLEKKMSRRKNNCL